MSDISFDATHEAFSVDAERRVIRGMAVPYNATAKKDGHTFQFSKGSLQFADVSRVKLWINHEKASAVGVAFELDDRDDGLYAAFRIARGPEGDRALSLAEDGVLDGLSVGAYDLRASLKDGVQHVSAAHLREVSLTAIPAFDNARITSVAASADSPQKETEMTEQITEATPDLGKVIADGLAAGFAAEAERHRKEGPVVITPTAQFEVKEEAPYRFDGAQGAHDFSTDLIAGLRDGDSEAKARVETFIKESFDVKTTNVTTLNPTRQRPDMYVDQRKFATPFYDAMFKGTLADITPFTFPKFNSASGLVAPHTEGVEPTPGAFSATSQTVQPSAVSGKVEITREVWDQGGSPQVSSLIWSKMTYAYYQALEGKAVALLDDASPTAIALTTGASDSVLVNQLEAAIADLNFQAGGNVFTFAGTHIDLYKKLAAASDTTGRKLLPIIGATNANGQATAGFKSLDVAGTRFTPATSLGGTTAGTESSYLVDTDSVHVWNTAPSRLEFQYRVAYVDLAIWGYVAAAISDLSGVREIQYDATV